MQRESLQRWRKGTSRGPWAEAWISWGSASEADHSRGCPSRGPQRAWSRGDKQAERAAWGPSSLSGPLPHQQ